MYPEFSSIDWLAEANTRLSVMKNVQFRNKYVWFAGSIDIYLLLRIPMMKLNSKIFNIKSPPRLYGIPFLGSLFTMTFMPQKFRLNIYCQNMVI